jgi:hypothetical protein
VVDAAAKAAGSGTGKKVAETVADGAVKAAVTTTGMSRTGVFGLSAGAVGILLTLFNTYKDTVGSSKGISAGSIVNPASVALGGGAALLTLGEKTFAANPVMHDGMRGAGVALVLGGLAGAIAGALKTNGNPLKHDGEPGLMDQVQPATPFVEQLAPAVNNLMSLKVATADVIGDGRATVRVPMYLDTTTTRAMPAATTLTDAIGQARAATQADELKRAYAVVQTRDGALSIVRMQGDLDQVDGPNFTKDNKYDARFRPLVSRHFESIKAIAGVQGYYDLSSTRDPIVPQTYGDEIPWVTPTLTPAKPSASASPSASATPATPAATTTAAASAHASASPAPAATATTGSGN